MKKFIFSISVIFFHVVFCIAQNKRNTFILRGSVTGRDTGLLILIYSSTNSKLVKDSALLRSGHFIFSGTISEPTIAVIQGRLRSSSAYDPNLATFFLEPSTMTVKLIENDYIHAKISGSATQQENEALNSELTPVLNLLLPLDKEYKKARTDYYVNGDKSAKNQLKIKALQKQIRPLLDQRDKIYYQYVMSHPNSYLSANILDNMDLTKLGGDSALMYYNGLSSKIQNSFSGKNVYYKITSYLRAKQASFKGGIAAVGSQEPDFSEKDLFDNLINLKSFKGKKYVLLDFWASWCPPCREAMPAIKEFYRQYNNSGLQVIGISLDFTREKCLAAVKSDQLGLWPQIFAGFFNVPGNFAKETFGILEIPQFILIDKTGKIIGRYAGLEDASSGTLLADQLKALFL